MSRLDWSVVSFAKFQYKLSQIIKDYNRRRFSYYLFAVQSCTDHGNGSNKNMFIKPYCRKPLLA